MTGAADQEEHDAIDVAVGRRPRAAGLGQRQTERRATAGMKEIAAGHAVAKRRGAIGIQANHEVPPDRSAESLQSPAAALLTYLADFDNQQ